MSKHPVMYHLTVRQLAASALHQPGQGINKHGQFFGIRHWCRVLLVLCSLQLMHSFTSLQGGQHAAFFSNSANVAVASGSTTTPVPIPAREQFSFEYKGLIQFKLSITENTGAGIIPAIHITTTLNQSDR